MLRSTLFLLTILLFFHTSPAKGIVPEGIPTRIATAIRSGDASQLAEFFNIDIQLNIPKQQGVYSKRQAQAVIADFFSINKPKSYNVSATRMTDNRQKITGILLTDTKTYRVVYHLSEAPGNSVVYFEIEQIK